MDWIRLKVKLLKSRFSHTFFILLYALVIMSEIIEFEKLNKDFIFINKNIFSSHLIIYLDFNITRLRFNITELLTI